MKTVRFISLLLSIISFVIVLILTITTAFFRYYILIGILGTSQVLSILTTIGVIFVSIYLFLSANKKKIVVISSVMLLIMAETIMLSITFLPKYRYINHISPENQLTVVVEEKVSHDQISVTFSKKVSGIFYKHIYGITLTDKKKDTYEDIGYAIKFDERYTRINIPANNSTQTLIPHK